MKNRIQLGTLSVLSLAVVMLLGSAADAAPRCDTKPAVCQRLQAQRAQRAPSATRLPEVALAMQAPESASARCASKPLVCARLAQAERQRTERLASAAVEQTAGVTETTGLLASGVATPQAYRVSQQEASGRVVAPWAQRCSTKPAVCARQRQAL